MDEEHTVWEVHTCEHYKIARQKVVLQDVSWTEQLSMSMSMFIHYVTRPVQSRQKTTAKAIHTA